VDVDVDLGDGRRLRGTVTGLYGDRVVKVNFSRLGPKHLLDAWIPLLALCAGRPGRPWTAGALGRGGRGQAVARTAFGSVDEAGTLLRGLVAIYDAGMREPLPLPLKTGHAWATSHPRSARSRAELAWSKDRFGVENEDEAHVRVWGREAPLALLLEQRPRPGEDHPDQSTRLGALACRLWQPILERGRS
jgi:exodeoxyribonuclease V gamma subunit